MARGWLENGWLTASSEAAINDFDTSVSRIVVVLPPLKNTNTSLVYVFVCDRVCKLLVRLNLNNRKLLRDEKRLFSGCYRPVGVSYVSRMWQVSLSCPPKSYNQSSFFFKNQHNGTIIFRDKQIMFWFCKWNELILRRFLRLPPHFRLNRNVYLPMSNFFCTFAPEIKYIVSEFTSLFIIIT